VNSAHDMGLAAALIISVIAGCQPRKDDTGTSASTSAVVPGCSHTFGFWTTAKKFTDSPLPPNA
jgi:hypothetical protein